MSESGDYDPGCWRGHDFGSAREHYDRHVGRSYEEAVKTSKPKSDLILDAVSTDSESPLVIACDVTGSMGEWPATIFSKLPYLELEGKEYMGPTMEICFAAVGDCYSDQYPLQVRPFTKGTDLKKRLEELVIESKGGPGANESYDLAALYFARNCKMPNAIKPLFIFIGDEGLYDFVAEDHAKQDARVDLNGKRLGYKQVIKELQGKFSVYLIRKMYEGGAANRMSDIDQRIYAQWAGVLGEDHISILPEAKRVVDVIFGIMAQETGRKKYFEEELKGRQKASQVDTVLKALETIHGTITPAAVRVGDTKIGLGSGMSIMTKKGKDGKGKKTKSLL